MQHQTYARCWQSERIQCKRHFPSKKVVIANARIPDIFCCIDIIVLTDLVTLKNWFWNFFEFLIVLLKILVSKTDSLTLNNNYLNNFEILNNLLENWITSNRKFGSYIDLEKGVILSWRGKKIIVIRLLYKNMLSR